MSLTDEQPVNASKVATPATFQAQKRQTLVRSSPQHLQISVGANSISHFHELWLHFL
jgi:hypothetical protein